MSHHRNPRAAGQEAAKDALEAAGVEKPDFCFTFATVGYDQGALLQGVREATRHAPLSGCSGAGVIAGGEADESNFAVAVMAVRSDQLRFSHGIVTGLGDDPAQTGRAIAAAVRPELSTDTLALFIFPDGLTVNFDRMVTGLEGELGTDHMLPLLGGTAANNWDASRPTLQYYDDHVVSDGVAWALLSGQARIAWAVNHGCLPIGIGHTVTRSEGNVIHELDGRPTLEILKDYLTDEDLENWEIAAMAFPLGIKAPGYMGDYDEYLIRVLLRKDDVTGSIAIPTEVSEGTSIRMTRRDYEKMAAGIEQVAGEIHAQLESKPAKLVFQFDCAGRGKVFLREQQKLQLLDTLQGRIGRDVPWLGLHTFGEISPVGGHNCFHNYTVVLVTIYE
jgi:hypothetical protein